MKKALTLYIAGIVAVGLSIWQPALGWLSPVTYLLVFPVCAYWLWRSEGRSLQDLGLRRDNLWRRSLGWGLLVGVMLPVVVMLVQAFGGWVAATPRALTFRDLATYIPLTLVKMLFVVAIEEFVARGYFLQRLALGMGVGWAALLSSGLWGLGHLAAMVSDGLAPFSIVIGMLTFVTWGIALSIGCWRSAKTLWLPFGLHYGVNISFSLLGIFFVKNYHAPQWWVGHPAWAPESGVFGLLVWLVAIGVVWRLTRLERGEREVQASLGA